ncbi:unnamed protein product [marine sediment metagenome]|uniref:Uncharacterized protein n=1 Tax=marine sediment metagenome TaxID=412755 RepID=X0SUG4_9ZZZZ
MSKLLTSCQLYNYRPRKDKSLSITFITGEKTPEEVMAIHSMLDDFGYLLFKAEEKLTKDEIEQLDNLDTDLYDNPKTQSQRIRGVIFRRHENDDEGYPEFKDFYKHKTDQIIEFLKKGLPERD